MGFLQAVSAQDIAETAYSSHGLSGKLFLFTARLLHCQESMALLTDSLTEKVIGCLIAVHRAIGPGLFESVYEKCVGLEFEANGIRHVRQVPLTLIYRGQPIRSVYRVDFVIENRLLVELKAIDRMLPVHQSQMLTYLKLSGLRQGLLVNFNVPKLVDGLKSFLR